MSGDPRFRRACEFLARTDEAVADERVELDFGTGIFDRRRPLVWDGNYVRVAAADLEAGELADRAEALFRQRGLAHRMLVFTDARAGERLAPGFADLGWEAPHFVVMPLAASAASVEGVEEISADELAEAVRRFERLEPPGGTSGTIAERVIEQLAERDRLIASVISERCFAIRRDGRLVSWCRLYSHGGTGQVENVATLPEHRRQGLAAKVALGAAAASVAAGDQLTFIVAEADGGARRIYQRLGFEAAGTLFRYRRTGAGSTARS